MPPSKHARVFLSGILLCLVLGCSAGTRSISRRCPVPTTASLVDFMTGLGLMGVGGIKFYAGKSTPGYEWTSAGVMVISSAYISELTCLK